uniref:putative sulfate exporter family transporter n=1 Tax=Mycobacterium avium TaxID=1764 RepID=UPI00373FDC17
MSTVRVAPDETDETADATFTSTRPLDYLPGILLLIGVGVLGKYAQIWWNALAKHEHWTVPDIEYVLWAIVIGLVITNTVGLHPIFRPGVLTYEFWLKAGIVALGSRFVLGDIAKLGGISLVQILVDMTIAGTIIIAVARWFGLSGKLGSLLAIGTSICGVSAIVAAKGAIHTAHSTSSIPTTAPRPCLGRECRQSGTCLPHSPTPISSRMPGRESSGRVLVKVAAAVSSVSSGATLTVLTPVSTEASG